MHAQSTYIPHEFCIIAPPKITFGLQKPSGNSSVCFRNSESLQFILVGISAQLLLKRVGLPQQSRKTENHQTTQNTKNTQVRKS